MLITGSTVLVGGCHEGNFNVSRLGYCSSTDLEGETLRHLVLVAAGTGFTPMPKLLQYFVAIVNEKAGKLKTALPSSLTLLFFNKTFEDIIWKELS